METTSCVSGLGFASIDSAIQERCVLPWDSFLFIGTCKGSIYKVNANGNLLKFPNKHNNVCCLVRYNDVLVTGGDVVIFFWNSTTGDLLRTIKPANEIRTLALWNDKLVSGGYKCPLEVWDDKGYQITRLNGELLIARFIVLSTF